jgi:hypothetical protein
MFLLSRGEAARYSLRFAVVAHKQMSAKSVWIGHQIRVPAEAPLGLGCPSSKLPTATQGAPKEEKKTTYLPTYPFLRFFEIFWSEFLGSKYFCGVFGLLMQRNDKNAIKKIEGKRRQENCFFSLSFFGKKLLTWISPKFFVWCF